jgi:hypothetical protein
MITITGRKYYHIVGTVIVASDSLSRLTFLEGLLFRIMYEVSLVMLLFCEAVDLLFSARQNLSSTR